MSPTIGVLEREQEQHGRRNKGFGWESKEKKVSALEVESMSQRKTPNGIIYRLRRKRRRRRMRFPLCWVSCFFSD